MKNHLYLKQCFEVIRGHLRPFEALWICPVLTDQKWSNWAEILHGGLKWKYKYTSNNVLRPSEAIRGHQRPSEAIWGRLNLSFLRIFKSLFEGVPDIRLGLYFVWLALFTSQFSWACFWGQGRVHSEVTRSFSRPFWDQGYIWHHDTWWSHLPIIYGSLLSLRLLWGCSRLPITIINSVWEYSSRSIELIFCVVGSFYTTIFMSIFFRPRSTPKQRSLKVTHGNLRPRSNLIAHESCCIKRDSHTKYEPNQTLKYSQT